MTLIHVISYDGVNLWLWDGPTYIYIYIYIYIYVLFPVVRESKYIYIQEQEGSFVAHCCLRTPFLRIVFPQSFCIPCEVGLFITWGMKVKWIYIHSHFLFCVMDIFIWFVVTEKHELNEMVLTFIKLNKIDSSNKIK